MTQFQISLNDEQRQILADVLRQVIQDQRVEKRHSALNTYREIVAREQTLLQQVLEKLQEPAAV